MSAPRPVGMGVRIGFLLLGIGVASSLVLGDWRWSALGGIALLVSAVVGAPRGGDRS